MLRRFLGCILLGNPIIIPEKDLREYSTVISRRQVPL